LDDNDDLQIQIKQMLEKKQMNLQNFEQQLLDEQLNLIQVQQN
jgi:hypothetical protein